MSAPSRLTATSQLLGSSTYALVCADRESTRELELEKSVSDESLMALLAAGKSGGGNEEKAREKKERELAPASALQLAVQVRGSSAARGQEGP